MHTKLNISKRAVLILICIMVLLTNIAVFPVGYFRELLIPMKTSASASDAHRCYLEYTLDKSAPASMTAGILRQTIIYVYAFKGETICLGSDIYDSHISVNEKYDANNESGADIVVVFPDSSVHPLDTQLNGVGYIGNLAQESNPPDYVGDKDNSQFYIPHKIVAPEDGIYEVRFHSYSGNRSRTTAGTHRHTSINPAVVEKNSENWKNSAATVGAWDVTVVDTNESDESKQIKNGRAYTQCLCLNSGDNNINISETYYVITSDGYIYRTVFSDLDPFGFVFFSNSRGLIDNDANGSAYHSYNTGEADLSPLMNKQNVSFHNPDNKDTDLDKTFRVFFEEPAPELEGVLYPKAYVPDDITNIEFIGSKCDNVSYVSDGGYFKFTVSKSTSATLTINFDEYNASNQTSFAPVTITQNAFAGDNYFYWDGCDGSGTVIPEGVYESGISVKITNHAGEYHFPLFDVENSNGRIYVERVNEIYERSVDANGVIYDKNVTADFEDQKYNVYYNNKIVPSGEILERNQLITDPDDIKYLTKYCYKYTTSKANEYEELVLNGGIKACDSYHVRVFNREATQEVFGLSDDDLNSLYERICSGENLDAFFDYYLIIADQKDCSEGINSSETDALHFEPIKDGSYIYRRGDITAIDIWTYSCGTPVETVLRRGIVIEDIKGYRHVSIQGKVFFDTNNNGHFNIHDGDYGLAGVEVAADYVYTEIRWIEDRDEVTNELLSLSCITADGKTNELTPTEVEGVFERTVDGVPVGTINVRCQELPHDETGEIVNRYYADIPVKLRTYTDMNGMYNFTGILILDDVEAPGNFRVNITKPSAFYTLTTGTVHTGDFQELTGTEMQIVSMQDIKDKCIPDELSSTFNVADVGYYYEEYDPPIILKKDWEQDVSDDPGRPDHIIFRVVGTTKDAPDSFVYDEEYDIYYYEDSWQETLSHLPKKYNGAELSYRVLYEKFEKNGVTYYFDGENYYSDYDSRTKISPPYYSTMSENKTYTGHILTVVNAEFFRTIEIVKLADNERQSGIAGAEFKAERYDAAAGEWVLVSESLVTNRYGIITLRDVPGGRYRFTEIKAPDGYNEIKPFEVELDEVTQICRKTIYEPPEKVSLKLTKYFAKNSNNIVEAFPEQEITFLAEFAYDADFTELLPESYTKTIITQANKESYVIFDDVTLTNSNNDKDVYVRITEQNAGSYKAAASVSAESVNCGRYDYSVSEYTLTSNDDGSRAVTFKLKPASENGAFTKYDVKFENTAKVAQTIRFQKKWFDSSMKLSAAAPSGVKSVYAKLMRRNTLTGDVEQVRTVMGGSGNGSGKYISIGTSGGYSGISDSEYLDQGYFSVAWNKNFTTGTYWLLPEYAPDGGKYAYFVQEVTNERGNPLCVIDGYTTPQYLYDYKVIPFDEYTETFTVDKNNKVTKINVVRDGVTLIQEGKPHDAIYSTAQSNYYILNRYAPELTLQITKNQLSDNNQYEETIPLKGAEFTLYSDPECQSELDKLITQDNGKAEFTVQLEYGKTYYLKETKAPSGYLIEDKILRLDYDGQKQLTITEPLSDGTSNVFKKSANEQNVVNITRTNVLNIVLPETGTDFTAYSYALVGLLMMGMAIIAVFILLKRVNAADDG